MRQDIPNFEAILELFQKVNVSEKKYLPENTETKCKRLAALNSNDKANCTATDILEAKQKEKDGEWVSSGTLRSIIVHLQLLDALYQKNHKREKDIIANLVAYLGNGYYYRVEDLEQLFALATQLYEFCHIEKNSGSMRLYEADKDDFVKLRVRSAKYLMRCGYVLEVKNAEIDVPNLSKKNIVNYLDFGIAIVGGMWFITALFKNEIYGKFHKGLERYLIMRDKKSIGSSQKLKASVPYAYLLQLGMKHLEDSSPLITEQGRRVQYEEILRVASAYLEILNLQGHSIMEDMFYSYEHFPMILSCNMLYEKLCIPRQYHPEYTELLVTKLIGPFYRKLPKDKQKFSLENYIEVMRYILKKANGPVLVSEEELLCRLPVSAKQLKEIMRELSYESSKVNEDFAHFLDVTNTWKRPLVHLSSNRYFCLDARLVGFAFYEVLYQLVNNRYDTKLKKRFQDDMGTALEKIVRDMFSDKRISFVKGKYSRKGDLPERDCDMIVEGDRHLLFVEIKKMPLPESYETGDDVAVLRALEKGMLYAQEQILWHRLRLHQYGVIDLDDEGKLIEVHKSGKDIYSISLCMPEYDFLSDQMIVKSFLESVLFVSYHAQDASRDNALKQLNKRISTIRDISTKLFDGQPYTSQDVFFNSSFMSLQQLWTALKFFPTKEKFLDYCSTSHCIVTGQDVYGSMWSIKSIVEKTK